MNGVLCKRCNTERPCLCGREGDELAWLPGDRGYPSPALRPVEQPATREELALAFCRAASPEEQARLTGLLAAMVPPSAVVNFGPSSYLVTGDDDRLATAQPIQFWPLALEPDALPTFSIADRARLRLAFARAVLGWASEEDARGLAAIEDGQRAASPRASIYPSRRFGRAWRVEVFGVGATARATVEGATFELLGSRAIGVYGDLNEGIDPYQARAVALDALQAAVRAAERAAER